MALADVSMTITTQNSFTDWVRLAPGQRASLSVGSVSTGTVTLQRRFDADDTARDVAGYTAASETTYQAGAEEWLRLGVKTGDLGSDQPVVRIKIG